MRRPGNSCIAIIQQLLSNDNIHAVIKVTCKAFSEGTSQK